MHALTRRYCWTIAFLLVGGPGLFAQENEEAPEPSPQIPQQLAGLSAREFAELVEKTRRSVVVVSFQGRSGENLGLGSGFFISEEGLIATNLHVIGEARPISVKLHDGREFEVTEIHATDRIQDLAILRIAGEERGEPGDEGQEPRAKGDDDADPSARTPQPAALRFQPLELAGPDELAQGEPVFALGNPQGLEQSVVTGVVSGFREHDDGMSLIQLAIPIERGNSGGPLLDMQGRVHGLLTLKSQVTDNLGYAVKASALEGLLEAPNPIPMSRWLTIGALNPRLWEVLSGENGSSGSSPSPGVRWRQRAGRILVDGTGRGFGGRSLCLWKESPPEVPFELAVEVKINEEDGAAGLIFHSDGGDRHYGFYPSSGQMRFSRFDGPSVYSWNVLEEKRTRAYRPDEWNRLKIRIEEGSFHCYVNDELVFEIRDDRYASGRVGLAKFRHTSAEFKRFEVADEIPSERPSEELLERIETLAGSIAPETPPDRDLLDDYADLDRGGRLSLERQARQLEARAERLRQLSREIHEGQIRQQLVAALRPEEGEPADLLRATLLLAALDNDELNVAAYEQVVGQLAEEFLDELSDEATAEEKLEAFHAFLFEEQGFHGSRTNYYSASNSYINEVIDDREGLPITLSVLYVELARRVGLEAEGVGLPGHFIVRVRLDEEESRLIDVFDRGTELTEEDCRERVRDITGLGWRDSYLDGQSAEAILTRMLRNLIRVANDEQDFEAAYRYVTTILAIDPDSAEDRLFRAVICYNTHRIEEGLAEVQWVLDRQPEGIVMPRVEQLREALERRASE
jgi:serine protease Do